MIRAALPLAVILVSATPALAQLFCTPPPEPSCIDTLSMSRDNFTFQMCRAEVEDYRRRVRQYIECLRDEQDQAIQRLNRVIDRFNACARSDFC